MNILTDAVLAFIPASLIYNLHMELKKRVNLCILLGLGVIAAICGIVKTTFLPSLGGHADITWNTYNLIVWAGSELFVLVFCGSVPPLKPLWDRYISKKSYSHSKASGFSGEPAGFRGALMDQPDQLLDSSSRPEYYLKGISDAKGQGGIRATMNIDVASSREWNNE